MKPKHITRSYTSKGISDSAYNFILIALIVGLIIYRPKLFGGWVWIIISILFVWVLFLIVRVKYINKTLQYRALEFERLRAQYSSKDIKFEQTTIDGLALTSLTDIKNVRNPRFFNRIENDEWSYSDFSYDIYRNARGGNYKYSVTYYSIMTVKLPRVLPNVFFDSKKARKSQFKMQFDQGQRHSLEGNFDQYFDTYFPGYYTIDSMSFISPEVMQSIIDASEYDIEISGDRLFLYGDLQEPKQQIKEMSGKILEIKNNLLHNITTYRDERLPYINGRNIVNPFGVSLWRNLTKDYIVVGFWGFILLFDIIMQLIQHEYNPIYPLYIAIILFVPAFRLIDELMRRKKDTEYMNLWKNNQRTLR